MQWATTRAIAPWLLFLALVGCEEDAKLSVLEPKLAFSPNSMDFCEVPVGATRRLRLSLSNSGTAELKLSELQVPEPFFVGTWPQLLKPGESIRVDLGFRPQNGDPQSAQLTLMSSDKDQPVVQIPVNGTGIPGVLTALPSQIDFSSTAVGTGRSAEIVLSSLAQMELSGGLATEGFARPHHYRLSGLNPFAAGGSFALAPGAEQTLELNYGPLESGEDGGIIRFEVCGDRCGIEVLVTASAEQAELVISPPAVDFGGLGIGEMRSEQILITNTGDTPAQIQSMQAVGSPDMQVTSGQNYPVTIAPSQSHPVVVSYSPSNTLPAELALTFATDNPVVPVLEARFKGVGQGPVFGVEPNPLHFGVERSLGNYRRILLAYNAGSSVVLVNSVSIQGHEAFSLASLPGFPLRLGPGESAQFEVLFKPSAMGEFQATVSLETDDAQSARVDIPVTAGVAERFCDLELDPTRVNFGLLPPMFERTRTIRLYNRGNDTCTLTGGDFRAPLDPTMTLVNAQTWPLSIAGGQSLELQFKYAPTAQVSAKANYVLQTDDPVFPERPISLIGTAEGYVDLFTRPEILDFGETKPMCSTGARVLTLYNAGSLPVQVSGITLSSSTAEFAMTNLPRFPARVGAGGNLTINVTYTPRDLGADQGTVEFQVQDLPYNILVPLLGAGKLTPTVVDRYEQAQKQAVDLLFVVDDSCSMADEQQALAANFGNFIRAAVVRNLDFQIGITTTTVDFGAGRLVGDILTNRTSNIEMEFANQAKVGIMGSGHERGLEALAGAVTRSERAFGSAKLFRSNSVKAFVIVSDEDDSSSGSALAYYNALRRKFNTIVTAGVTGQIQGCGNAYSSPRYEEFLRLSGGVSLSICNAWAATLARLGQAVFGLRDSFELSQNAVENTIEVRFDGSVQPRSSYSYDPASKTVIFNQSPPEGSEITISYEPDC